MTTFRRSLNVIIKSKMSKMRMNINVKEFLRDTFYNNNYNRQHACPNLLFGLSETPFKSRFANHKSYRAHCKHVLCLKEAGLKFKITWKILKQTFPYNPVKNQYNLCLWEKYFIINFVDLS